MPSDELVNEINQAIETSESKSNDTDTVSGDTEQNAEESQSTEEAQVTTEIDVTTAADDTTEQEVDETNASGDTTVETESLSDAILERAIRVGISLVDAKAFPSEAALSRVVESFEKMDEDSFKTQQEETATEESTGPLDGLPTLDPEKFEPEVVEAFDALKEVIQQQQEAIQEMRSQQEQTHQSAMNAAGQELEQWFDGQVSALGDDYKEALGDGGLRSLNQGSSQFAKRDAIANQMAVLINGYEASGQPIPPREEVFSMATKLVLSDEMQRINEQKLSGELGKRATQHVNRANGRKATQAQSPEEETAELLNAKFG